MDIRQASPGAASHAHALAAFDIVSPHLSQIAQEFCTLLRDAGHSPAPELAAAMAQYWQNLLSASGPETIIHDLGENPLAKLSPAPSAPSRRSPSTR